MPKIGQNRHNLRQPKHAKQCNVCLSRPPGHVCRRSPHSRNPIRPRTALVLRSFRSPGSHKLFLECVKRLRTTGLSRNCTPPGRARLLPKGPRTVAFQAGSPRFTLPSIRRCRLGAQCRSSPSFCSATPTAKVHSPKASPETVRTSHILKQYTRGIDAEKRSIGQRTKPQIQPRRTRTVMHPTPMASKLPSAL